MARPSPILLNSAGRLVNFAAVLALAGCAQLPAESPPATAPVASPPLVSGSAALTRAMSNYDEGDYGEAATHFRLALEQRLSAAEQVKARKHLAFAYCVAGKERLCSEEFRKLLEASPGFELDPAEAGHPIWGPVFRRVKVKKPELKK